MKKILPKAKTIAVSSAALFFLSINLLKENALPTKNTNPINYVQYKKQKSKNQSWENTDNAYSIQINLPEFKSRLYENNLQIDSSVISPGRYSRRSPLLFAQNNLITIRPYFSPTPSERAQFRPNRSDRTNYPQRPSNALGRFRIVLNHMHRMHGTSIVSSISKLDTNGHVLNGQFRSNGCIRHDNFAGERLIAKILRGSKIDRVAGTLKDSISTLIQKLKSNKLNPQEFITQTPNSLIHNVYLHKPIQLRVHYRLWDKKMTLTKTKLNLTIHRDIYNYSQGRNIFSLPSNKKNQNSYSFEHFKRDLQKNQILFKEQDAKEIYQKLKKELKTNKSSAKTIQLEHNQKLFSPNTIIIY